MAKHCKWMIKYVMYSWRPPTSTLRPPCYSHDKCSKALPFFTTLLLPCIIVKTKSKKEKQEGPGNEAGRGLGTKQKTNPNPQSSCFNTPTVWQQPCLTSQTQATPAWIILIIRPHPEKRLVTHVKLPYMCCISSLRLEYTNHIHP